MDEEFDDRNPLSYVAASVRYKVFPQHRAIARQAGVALTSVSMNEWARRVGLRRGHLGLILRYNRPYYDFIQGLTRLGKDTRLAQSLAETISNYRKSLDKQR